MKNQDKVCAEIHEIMATYREQDARGAVDTPGGLEHMGDVWRMLAKWDLMLEAADLPQDCGGIETFTSHVLDKLVGIKGRDRADVAAFILKSWVAEHRDEIAGYGITVSVRGASIEL